MLFASLFATYLALKDRVPNGDHPLSKDLFNMEIVFTATMLLLISSLTSVIAMHHMKNFNFKKMHYGFVSQFYLMLLSLGGNL